MFSEVFKQLHLENQKNTKRVCLQNAESSKAMGILIGYEVMLQIGSKSVDWAVYVTLIQNPLLFGLDFMLEANITIQKDPRVFTLFNDGEPIPSNIKCESVGSYTVSRVLLTESSTLLQQNECNVWGLVEDPRPGVTAVLESVGLADGVSSGNE